MRDNRPMLIEGEDFYWEGTAMVFTARYHLRRGHCCESGCRHCPYRDDDVVVNGKREEKVFEECVE